MEEEKQKNAINQCRRREGNIKLSLSKHHSNHCCRHDLFIDAKISKVQRETGYFHRLKVSLHKIFMRYKRENILHSCGEIWQILFSSGDQGQYHQ